jgi:hypothetical protein
MGRLDVDYIREQLNEIPEYAAELRDKRTNWALREKWLTPLGRQVMVCQVWQLRNRATKSVKAECCFCARTIAITKGNHPQGVDLACILCWFSAGKPHENEMVGMEQGKPIPDEAAQSILDAAYGKGPPVGES